MGDAYFGDVIKIGSIYKWFRSVWAKSFFVVLAFFVGFTSGGTATEWRIMSDCKHLNAFRVDINAYSCNMKVIEK